MVKESPFPTVIVERWHRKYGRPSVDTTLGSCEGIYIRCCANLWAGKKGGFP